MRRRVRTLRHRARPARPPPAQTRPAGAGDRADIPRQQGRVPGHAAHPRMRIVDQPFDNQGTARARAEFQHQRDRIGRNAVALLQFVEFAAELAHIVGVLDPGHDHPVRPRRHDRDQILAPLRRADRPDPDPSGKPRFSGRMRGQPGGSPGPGLGRHFARVGMEIDHHHVGRQGRSLVEAGGITGRDVEPRAHGD